MAFRGEEKEGRGKGICSPRTPSSLTPPLTRCPINSRQFNHRCKGVTMATFKPEEIQAIEDGGNAVREEESSGALAADDTPHHHRR
jgi:hypothetical protein